MLNNISNISGKLPSDSVGSLPELLCPAGSQDSLEAAVACGADAVYFGVSDFNARINAQNFLLSELESVTNYLHRYGVRAYLTLNTLVYDRELRSWLDTAILAACAGIDALIVADIGTAAALNRVLPEFPLHASTQLGGHCSDIGKTLSSKGFSRFVMAREATIEDIRCATRNSGLEVEVFVHGALCVSHSGQCLFSSVVGGRSGNRGECAQPCRLPYSCREHCRESYPLSLKDLSLAAHVPELIECGVSSLKIEGRMKSADYVKTVTSVWRRLLDEKRAATEEELLKLADVFSRGGFTDGYFVGDLGHRMMGVRGDADKKKTASAEKMQAPKQGFLPLSMKMEVHAGEQCRLEVTSPLWRSNSPEKTISVSVSAPPAEVAQNLPTDAESVRKNLIKTGGTAYYPTDVEISIDNGLMMPMSRVNSMRREALERCNEERCRAISADTLLICKDRDETESRDTLPDRSACNTARFRHPESITQAAVEYFSLIYLPLDVYISRRKTFDDRYDRDEWGKDKNKLGVIMPPIIFDREIRDVEDMLLCALNDGIEHIVVGNLGHLPIISRAADKSHKSSLSIHGDWRLNVTNNETVRELKSLGFCDLILSPELTLPRMRDISGPVSSIVYGYLTLMTLEKCAIRELYGEGACEVCGRDGARMCDRRGIIFPVLREWKHRNIVINSVPLSMTDREEDLVRANVKARHFVFTVENVAEVDHVISAAREKSVISGEVRRISK